MKKGNRATIRFIGLALVIALLAMIAPNLAAMANEAGDSQEAASGTMQTPDDSVTQVVYDSSMPISIVQTDASISLKTCKSKSDYQTNQIVGTAKLASSRLVLYE